MLQFTPSHINTSTSINHHVSPVEKEQVDWLMLLFSNTFLHQHNTILVRGLNEPEYFPAEYSHDQKLLQPAQIVFAHGFFASALHEISHWCIAGKKRRQLSDFGYCYEPDGRSVEQQKLFEQVEIKPQALEWMFTVLCGRDFRVSLDNLSADITESSNFKKNVYKQVDIYLQQPALIPQDAQKLMFVLAQEFSKITINEQVCLSINDFCVDNI